MLNMSRNGVFDDEFDPDKLFEQLRVASAKVRITFYFSHFFPDFSRIMPITFAPFWALICG